MNLRKVVESTISKANTDLADYEMPSYRILLRWNEQIYTYDKGETARAVEITADIIEQVPHQRPGEFIYNNTESGALTITINEIRSKQKSWAGRLISVGKSSKQLLLIFRPRLKRFPYLEQSEQSIDLPGETADENGTEILAANQVFLAIKNYLEEIRILPNVFRPQREFTKLVVKSLIELLKERRLAKEANVWNYPYYRYVTFETADRQIYNVTLTLQCYPSENNTLNVSYRSGGSTSSMPMFEIPLHKLDLSKPNDLAIRIADTVAQHREGNYGFVRVITKHTDLSKL